MLRASCDQAALGRGRGRERTKEGRGLRHALKLWAAGPAAGAAQSGPGAAAAGQLDNVRGASPGGGRIGDRQRRGGVAAPGARCPRAAPLGRGRRRRGGTRRRQRHCDQRPSRPQYPSCPDSTSQNNYISRTVAAGETCTAAAAETTARRRARHSNNQPARQQHTLHLM